MVDFIYGEQKDFVIYGAGVYGKRVYETLQKKGKRIRGFVVSHKDATTQNTVDGLPVYSIADVPTHVLEDVAVLVAIKESLHAEVKESIDKENLRIPKERIHFLSEAEVCELFRDSNPVDFAAVLSRTEPVSRGWGYERGTPVDRYFIEGFLKKESMKYPDMQLTFEVGEDTYSRKFFSNACHEILDYSKGMDLTIEGSIPSNRYDMFICTQTFHQIYDVKKAIQGSWDLLKDGGIMLATVCGTVTKQARNDEYKHFWGFTESSITRLMQEVYGDNVAVTPYGNAMVATAFIQGLAAEELDPELMEVLDDDYTICLSIVAKKVCK